MAVPSIVAQLLSYPLGVGMHKILPHHWFINPGPFNIKEHALIVIMANVGNQSAYATDSESRREDKERGGSSRDQFHFVFRSSNQSLPSRSTSTTIPGLRTLDTR